MQIKLHIISNNRYALTCKPEEKDWTDPLRDNFLHGLSSMMELLNCMQGMDAVTRQTGQHIEFEPEWEGAFNLQLKLEDNIAIMLDWCATDVSSTFLPEDACLTIKLIRILNEKRLLCCRNEFWFVLSTGLLTFSTL